MTLWIPKVQRCQQLRAVRARRGFTLIELLITMGVIAILAGILLPVIHIARVQAKVANTKNLLSQVSGALGRYNEDWGHFPPDAIDHAEVVKFVNYDPDAADPGENRFSATCRATGEALYYYLANPNITRKHPYLELQADIQFKMQGYSGDYNANKLRVVVDAWERPVLYNRPAWAGKAEDYFNVAGDPIHEPGAYDLFSVGPNGQTAAMNLDHPRDNYNQFNEDALDPSGGADRSYGEDEDDIVSW